MNAIIGQPIRRREDVRFITGRGRYTDDVSAAGQAFAAFARSPHARAKIRGIDKASAKAVPGVIAVFTGADLAAGGIGMLPCGWLVKSTDGSDMKVAPRPPLAIEQVNFVGEPYAVVIAGTRGRDAGSRSRVAWRFPRPGLGSRFDRLPFDVDLRLTQDASAHRVHHVLQTAIRLDADVPAAPGRTAQAAPEEYREQNEQGRQKRPE